MMTLSSYSRISFNVSTNRPKQASMRRTRAAYASHTATVSSVDASSAMINSKSARSWASTDSMASGR